ncbi:MAG: hypothetical protein LBU95_00365 [Rikenellaceae bacterium]|nr:hypothetical protein [Rikenellaceae bacterium]
MRAQRQQLCIPEPDALDAYGRINARTTDITQKAAYSLVFVHTWTKDFTDIKKVVDNLNSNVRVVIPDVFVKLIVQNVPH